MDPAGCRRELVVVAGAHGSSLVVDRDASTLGDLRLLAHLAADEPAANADVVCAEYLADTRGRACRSVRPEDLEIAPVAEPWVAAAEGAAPPDVPLVDPFGCAHRLEPIAAAGLRIPELRWIRRPGTGACGPAQPVSLREVVARLEQYEPARTLTARTLAAHRRDGRVSVAVLRTELERVATSRIVLNRGLREAVVDAVAGGGVSMSAIAVRCGRVKRDARGNVSGETSWLARRLGLLPEGGERLPTPWIHTDVLALIARCGLGISPREVELG